MGGGGGVHHNWMVKIASGYIASGVTKAVVCAILSVG